VLLTTIRPLKCDTTNGILYILDR